MAYNEELSIRIKKLLIDQNENFVEKKMFGGLAFMINDKMCIGVVKDQIMLRVMDEVYETLLDVNGVNPMDFSGKIMKGFLFIDPEAFQTNKNLLRWINFGLEFAEKGVVKSKKKK
jgi:TfoX/Sxy family transcriptional regulator of competence genes